MIPLGSLGILGGGWAIPAIPMHHQGEACYVHITTAAGAVVSIVERLADVEDVSGVAVLSGECDVLAEIPLPREQAGRVILEEIHAIPGVVATKTAVSVPGDIGDGGPEEEDRDQFSAWS